MPPAKDPAFEPRSVLGMDHDQNMILWSLPAAMQGQDLVGRCTSSGPVDRVLQAAAKGAIADDTALGPGVQEGDDGEDR